MANVHNISIVGFAPFDLPNRANNDLKLFLTWMMMPTFGFKITWGEEKKFAVHLPDGRKAGTYYYYDFEIKGAEAMWEANIIENVNNLIKAGCGIQSADVEDIEYPVPLHSVLKKLHGILIQLDDGTMAIVRDNKWLNYD